MLQRSGPDTVEAYLGMIDETWMLARHMNERRPLPTVV